MVRVVHFLCCLIYFSASLIPSNWLLRSTLLVFLLSSAVNILGGRTVSLKRAELYFSTFILFCLISIAWTLSNGSKWTAVADLLGILACFLLLHRNRISVRSHRQYAALYILGCCIASVLVISNWMAQVDFEGSGRYSSGSINPNYIAYCCAGAVCLACYYWSKGWSIAGLLAAVLLLIGAIFLTGTRGAIISCVVSIAFTVLRSKNFSFKRKILLVSFFVVALAVLLKFLPVEFYSRFIVDEYEDAEGGYSSGRFDTWAELSNYPWYEYIRGFGYDSFSYVTRLEINPHNIAIQLIFEVGVVGLILYLLTFWGFFRKQGGSSSYLNSLLILAWLPLALTGVWGLSPVAWLIYSWMRALPLESRKLF